MCLRSSVTHLSILSACLALCGLAGTDVLAKTGSRVAAASKGGGHRSDHQIIKELHHARGLLERAKHDYQGHRVKAVHHVNHAIHALREDLGSKQGKSGQAKTGTKGAQLKQGNKSAKQGNNEGQGQSDDQLRHAIKILRHAEHQLARGKSDGHRHRAHEEIHHAIHQLEEALSVK